MSTKKDLERRKKHFSNFNAEQFNKIQYIINIPLILFNGDNSNEQFYLNYFNEIANKMLRYFVPRKLKIYCRTRVTQMIIVYMYIQ